MSEVCAHRKYIGEKGKRAGHKFLRLFFHLVCGGFESLMTHGKLNCWDKDCLVKAAPFQWQLPIPWLASLEQQD